MASRRTISKRYSPDQSEIESDSEIEENVTTRPTKLTKYHVLAFVLTFVSYALFHATRKTFSNVKVTITATWTPQNKSLPELFDDNWNGHNLFDNSVDASVFLGVLDTVFMTSYAVGLFISGAIGDRLNLRYVLAFGMCSSSITVFMFGVVSEWLHLYSKIWYIVFWTLTGLLQSTGWPTVVAVIGNWFGKSSRGFVMGVWGASPSVGNIVGTCIVNLVLHFGYQYSFLITSSITFAFGIVILFSLVASPRDVGLPDPCGDHPDKQPLLRSHITDSTFDGSTYERPKAVGLCHACCLPGVIAYSLAYACLKFVNYSFFFWLPFYLQMAYNWTEDKADLLSVWYDVGGVIGGVLIGYISDKMESRAPILGLMLFLSPFSLYLYSNAPNELIPNASLMVLTGTIIGGVASLISTAVSADLGRHPELANSKEALSTVTGIIDGTGSFGAAIGQVLVPIIMNSYGWRSVFNIFMVMTVLTLLCISNIVYRDTMSLIKRVCGRRNYAYLPVNEGLVNAETESIK